MFFRSQSYDFDAVAHAGAPRGVERLRLNRMDSFEKFQIFIERSGEKSTSV